MYKAYLCIIFIASHYVAATAGIFRVTGSLYDYSVQVPEGWDLIPAESIATDLQQDAKIDCGLFPVNQQDYFEGNFVVTHFMPVNKELTNLTFKQIIDEITVLNRQNEVRSDTLSVRFDKMIPDEANYCLRSYFSVSKGAVEMRKCHTLYLTKHGYVSVVTYSKSGGKPIGQVQNQMSGLIQVAPEFCYSEPLQQSASVGYFIFSLTLALVVYVILSILAKKRDGLILLQKKLLSYSNPNLKLKNFKLPTSNFKSQTSNLK